MTYSETIQYLESFINYEKITTFPYKESFKLQRIKGFLKSIGNPQDSLRCIHIAGTKGKGSTCAFCAYILREAGYKVGLYTSPHLSDFRERIRILEPLSLYPAQAHRNQNTEPRTFFEGMITQDELINLVERLKPLLEKYKQISRYGELSFFEVYTALALVYFKEKKVDFAVLETGLGGRLDSTNAVNAYVCAITSISFEHIKQLGNTLKKIAIEKSGIIKNQESIVITAPQEKEVLQVIRNRCRQVGAKLYEVNKDIFYERGNRGFDVLGIFGEYPNLAIKLLGEHQIINASLAIGVIEALRFFDIILDIDSIRKGLYDTVWPGRCEVVSLEPWVVLDGAQNIASVEALKIAIKENFRYKKLILILGICLDKDIVGICSQLQDFADKIVLTRSNNPRAIETDKLASYFNGKDLHLSNTVREASNIAFSLAKKEDLVLVTGSLFVVGEYRDIHSRMVSSSEASSAQPAQDTPSIVLKNLPILRYEKFRFN